MKIPQPGETLDHYRIEEIVGRGGMSTLLKAVDLNNDRHVAIKIPHEEMEADPVLMERFKREQKIGQELDHPGVVKTFDSEKRSGNYMVIEWVEGRLLRAIMNAEGVDHKRRLPIERAVKITLGICYALDYMHKRGVVHRDLKPENIMVDDRDQIKLIDFGIAMKEDARRLTFVNLKGMLGTPDYIAPEQVKGNRGDQRSDIYSLGVMLYEMLTGHPPFRGPNPLAVMNERLMKDPEPARKVNAEISVGLQEVLNRALEREPRHRYSTASEMAWDLEHQDQLGAEINVRKQPALGHNLPGKRRLLMYAALLLVPFVLFALMLLLARH
jgi:eukaryotic-like serine/threonine-protein kinase